MQNVMVAVPGRPPIAVFDQVGEYFSCALTAPSTVTTLCLMLLAPLPSGVGAGLFCSVPPYDSGEFITLVANECPTQIVSTGFSTRAALQDCAECRLLLRLDKLDAFKDMYIISMERAGSRTFAFKVANHLYNFVRSFKDQPAQGQEVMNLPVAALERWLMRFEEKLKLDPCFLDR